MNLTSYNNHYFVDYVNDVVIKCHNINEVYLTEEDLLEMLKEINEVKNSSTDEL